LSTAEARNRVRSGKPRIVRAIREGAVHPAENC
jgi:hypothetical protein